MIRVIVVWPGRKDNVRLGFANEPNDLLAILQSRHQLAVGIVKNLILSANNQSRLPGFLRAPFSQRPAAHGLVPGAAIGQ